MYFEQTLLLQVFKQLTQEGLLSDAKPIRMTLKKPPASSRHCYTQAQVKAILGECRKSGLAWLEDMILGFIYTGLRAAELTNLRWDEVDTTNLRLHKRDLSHSGQHPAKDRTRTTKNHRDRSLPIHPKLLTVLQRRFESKATAFVFTDHKDRPVTTDTTYTQLKRIVARLAEREDADPALRGISRGTVHSFRHYFVSTCSDHGVSPHMLMSWLGHGSSEMVNLYYHQRRDEAHRQMNNVHFFVE